MKMAKSRIESAVMRPIVKERQRQLLGLTPDDTTNVADLLEAVYAWWMQEVMTPAQRIALNPAASCAEAQLSLQLLLGVTRQKQLIGIEDSDQRSAELSRIFKASEAMVMQRCRDEALDECVATGRLVQVPQTALAQARQAALLGSSIDVDSWVDDALKQCAIYELHFASTAKIDQSGMMVERVYNGKIEMTIDKVKDGQGVLYGQTGGNLTDVSLKCAMPGITVICKPGSEIDSGFKAWIRNMDLQHPEFYVDANGISKKRVVGENKLQMELSGDAKSISMLMVIPNGPTIPAIEWPAGGLAFYTAHKKDSVTAAGLSNVKFERDTRGVYPTLFEFTYADQDSANGISATDSTIFKLIHKPKPKPFPERSPDLIRKPLKPRA